MHTIMQPNFLLKQEMYCFVVTFLMNRKCFATYQVFIFIFTNQLPSLVSILHTRNPLTVLNTTWTKIISTICIQKPTSSALFLYLSFNCIQCCKNVFLFQLTWSLSFDIVPFTPLFPCKLLKGTKVQQLGIQAAFWFVFLYLLLFSLHSVCCVYDV